jgi:site-specific recombinase XerD
MRIAEACDLKIEDVNLETGILRVISKGDKQGEVVISDRLKVALLFEGDPGRKLGGYSY